ncbi:MAG: Polyhydroxyalkanoic acid synthase [Myxococcaceae bacterium]|nr:Polyhydroxyalkanoic acid synthase [Myxococcaceae bacterium]
MNPFAKLAAMVAKPKPPVGTTPADVIHRENKWRLLRYRPAAGARDLPKFQTPVLLVPSLINRHYVMDLLPGKSLAEDLVKAGHDVYCLDWGTPGDEDRHLTFDDICDRYLGRAIRKVAKRSPRGKTHVLGYCLGGTLATIHAAVHQEHVASLLVLAAPVGFEGEVGLLETWTRLPSFKVSDVVDAFGNVPWQLMQSAFTMLRPTLGMSKAVHVVDKALKDDPINANKWDEFSEGFRALEAWGNDNVSFPGACYVRYIEELYRKDALIKGTFTLSGKPVHLEKITVPTMCIVFQHDNIVPLKNASILVEKIGSTDKELVSLPGGHVGAVVSRGAQKTLWPRMSAFWAKRDSDVKLRVDASADASAKVEAPAAIESEPHVEAPPKKMNGHAGGPPPASALRTPAKKTSKNKTPSRSGSR